jgi:hypothetical protein
LALFDEVRKNRQRMTRIRRPYEAPPGYRSQTELLHHTAKPRFADFPPATFQFRLHSSITIARKLLVNAFDLLAQFLVVAFAPASMLRIGFVVIGAGGNPCYLAGFRN